MLTINVLILIGFLVLGIDFIILLKIKNNIKKKWRRGAKKKKAISRKACLIKMRGFYRIMLVEYKNSSNHHFITF